MKSLNPPTASYALGTCSDVYCHSKTDWSSPDAISSPLLAPDGNAMLDANGNLVYDPYVVTVSTVYASIGWNDGPRDCNGCHRNNPQTAWPDVQASVGNTHAWISDWGWEDLHAWNHGLEPIPCRSCHNSTVTEVMTYSRDSWDITYFDDAAIANKVYHVNGVKDVVFDPVNPFVYNSSSGPKEYSLASISYDLDTKVCSDVGCHKNQPNPEWGKPYRWGWGSLECDQCHRYGGPWPPVVGGPWPPAASGSAASGSAATQGIPSSSTLSAHQQYSEQGCLDCHQSHEPTQ